MLLLAGGGSGSPLEARATAPIFLIFFLLFLIFAVLGAIFIISLQITKYKKSEKYIQKVQNLPTKKKDVVELGKNQHFSSTEINLIWKICSIAKFPNINYNLKAIDDVDKLFRSAFPQLKESAYFNNERLDNFFSTLYKMELMVAQRKTISSTRQINVGRKIAFLSNDGGQHQLTVVENTRDSMTLEIPDYINEEKGRPEPLARSRFTYKTPDGLTYNFIARVIRYENNIKEGVEHNFMVLSHSEQLESQAQRHFKREFTDQLCTFCSLKFTEDKESGELKPVYSDKIYKGKLANISGGGCCIHTNLPVKERQNISVSIAGYDIWKVPGVIRKTRRLPGGKFALHIQFSNLPLTLKNKIQAIIYKYDF